MHVVAPASSANLGPGFDALGLALDLPFELVVDGAAPEGFLAVEPTHPTAVAFVEAGGADDAPLWWRSPIPPGRGLGFSGAARVAGAVAAGETPREAFRTAARLERHPDNAAASAFGGFVVAAADEVVTLPVPHGLALAVWWPSTSTSTDASRRRLPQEVPFDDAVFSAARAALWVAAVASGDLSVLRTATEDRLHQPTRVRRGTGSAEVLAAWRDDPRALGAWLSGSGPTVAALAGTTADAEALAELAPQVGRGSAEADAGRARTLEVASSGVRVLDGP
ncbi:MAG: homoserine kinase [Actinomycetes bacterium]